MDIRSRRRPKTPLALPALLAGMTLVAVVVLAGAAPAAATKSAHVRPSASAAQQTQWRWPVGPFRIVEGFRAPAHAYGPGHRGIDLLPATTDELVRAPRAGVVAFSGRVADRGIVTIDHGDGFVTTLEPVRSELSAGAQVAQGAVVGTISHGGHTRAGAVHFGVRYGGEYVNPALLLDSVPPAVLLPCCS